MIFTDNFKRRTHYGRNNTDNFTKLSTYKVTILEK